MSTCCPCDEPVLPLEPNIPAGLRVLPRQAMGFPEYRQQILAQLRHFPALAGWRAREGDDLGLMLLESWAYVLDVVGFYDQQIAQNLYLGTATDAGAMRRLTALIGYRPRPAVAADGLIAAFADRGPAVDIPAWTAFRSEAFGSNPPQIFESDADSTIDWHKNRWTLAPVVPNIWSGDAQLLLDARTLRLTRGGWAAFDGAVTAAIAQVTDLQTIRAVDGGTYVAPSFSPAVSIPALVPLQGVRIRMATATARLNAILSGAASSTALTLDAIYPGLLPNDDVIVAWAGTAVLVTIKSVSVTIATAASGSGLPSLPATKIEFTADLGATPGSDAVVRFQLIDAGRLVRPASIRLQNTDLLPSAALAGVVEPLDGPAGGPLLAQDADLSGQRIDGTVAVPASGAGSLVPSPNLTPFDTALVPPVNLYGNVLHVVRGETVAHEVLGSGDASQAFPTFQLKKKPLTYVASAAAPGGRKSTLAVRVNGLLWTEVPGFYGTQPGDAVYIVRQDENQETFVTFWRLPSGVDNVTARYRFGAGAPSPPADSLSQIVRPVKGLARILSPTAPGGGSDADQPKDIQRDAPTVALTLGRAVSIDDFEALARGFGGVRNVSAGWAWDTAQQRAVVKLWYISNGGDIAESLRAFLVAQADPTIGLSVESATPLVTRLIIDLVTDPRYDATAVTSALIETLSDPDTGVLSHANVPIAGNLFRSELFAVASQVSGVASINGMTVNGITADFVLTAPEGQFLDFLPFTNS
jgi:hypothetical protein